MSLDRYIASTGGAPRPYRQLGGSAEAGHHVVEDLDEAATYPCPLCQQQTLGMMHDRFSAQDLQTMIDLYLSGVTGAQVAEQFGISLPSVK